VNVLHLAALVDRIASYFSRDAAQWRPAYVRTSPAEPIPLSFRFVAGMPSYAPDLLAALRTRIAAPYTTNDYPGAPIVAADETRPARAVIELRADERDGAAGVAYEVHFTDSAEVIPGWFRVGAI
jgi:hypothetical protein